ncbi:hypothetical protein HHK36_008738 [Tetracentron sinense]|uniref:Uncharacterized protein n=1 Tax=Tetracentron sinense TaxID=13715 RepID=A0A835DK98_TETSI|nr:hypothetical protein HHK36_008738 [Tetracentron sinense]
MTAADFSSFFSKKSPVVGTEVWPEIPRETGPEIPREIELVVPMVPAVVADAPALVDDALAVAGDVLVLSDDALAMAMARVEHAVGEEDNDEDCRIKKNITVQEDLASYAAIPSRCSQSNLKPGIPVNPVALEDIRHIQSRLDNIAFLFVPQEVNVEVHVQAQLARSLSIQLQCVDSG